MEESGKTRFGQIPQMIRELEERMPWFKAATAISADFDSKAREAVLTAINHARQWVDQLVTGTSLPEIAIQEGKSPRYIRLLTSLAFIPPRVMSEIVNGERRYTAAELAGHVPLVW